MMLMKRMLTGAALVALSTGSAAAAPAVVEAGIDLRSGPGTQFAVVTVIPPGATVDVRGCQGRWCQVSFAGVVGFADRGYLRLAGPLVAPAYGPAYAAYERPYAYDDDYAGYGPAYGYGYAGDYAYYDGGYYGPGYRSGVSVGVATGERTFTERRAVRGEVRTSAAAVGVREGSVSRRTTEERAATISGNNAMLNAGGSAAASTREDANVRGNRAGARVRAGAGGSANANA